MPDKPAHPFSLTYTAEVPGLLQQLQASLAISTYQAGKLILLSAPDGKRLVQLPRTFPKPMGIGLREDGQTMAVAVRDSVIVFQNSRELAWHYPNKPQTYDAMFLPRMVYLTNPLDIHDLDWVGDDLMAVNTLFSCIIRMSAAHNFEVVWKPPFIDHLASEDRCHLNGMAVENGAVRFATAFSTTNTPMGWKQTIPDSGVVLELDTGEQVAGGLAMPHSPRMINGELYVLLSATGQVVMIDQQSGKLTEVSKIKGFVRGMAYHKGFLFVGHSQLREKSSSFGKLSLPYEKSAAGITILHLATGKIAGQILYQESVEEIYDLRILPGLNRPNVLNMQREEYKLAISTPGQTYWARPDQKHDDDKTT